MVEKKQKTEMKEDAKIKSSKEAVKSSPKEDAKMKELKIELLKQTSKKRDVRKEIARLLTLQTKNMETTNKLSSPSAKANK